MFTLFAAFFALATPGHAQGAGSGDASGKGAVFAMTNGLLGNRVTSFERGADGRLKRVGSFATGGTGSGVLENNATGLLLGDGEQQSPTDLGGGDRFVFAVNAGSNSITVFERRGTTLRRVEIERSTRGNINHPISVTLHSDVLYVLNGPVTNCTGGLPTISGFRVSNGGRLTPIAGSTQPVPGGLLSGCAQVAFDPEGEQLIVSERQTDNLATYPVDDAGRAGPPRNNATTEIGPFGMNFAGDDVLITAVNNGALPLLGGVTSYAIQDGGGLTPLDTVAVRNGRSDTCWIEITDDGRFAYTTNFQTGDISSYRVGSDGRLTLIKSVAASVHSPLPGAFDLALVDSRFLYAIDSNLATVSGYEIGSDGSLKALGEQSIGSLPGTFGVAAT